MFYVINYVTKFLSNEKNILRLVHPIGCYDVTDIPALWDIVKILKLVTPLLATWVKNETFFINYHTKKNNTADRTLYPKCNCLGCLNVIFYKPRLRAIDHSYHNKLPNIQYVEIPIIRGIQNNVCNRKVLISVAFSL